MLSGKSANIGAITIKKDTSNLKPGGYNKRGYPVTW